MTDALKALLASKKFTAGILAAITFLLVRLSGKFGWGLSQQEAADIADRLLALAMLVIGGQALEDHGKAAAQVQVGASAPEPVALPPKA